MQRLLFVSSEAFPFIKTGGLGDVAAGLPAALVAQGHDLRLLLPGYPAALAKARTGVAYELVRLEIAGTPLRVIETQLPGSAVTTWLLECPPLFERPGNPYLNSDGQPWPDNHRRFALLCRLAVELAMDRAGLAWRPDIVHCNDWQTGLVPALLSLETQRPATVFTVHNLAYQGMFPHECFEQLGLPAALWSHHSLEYYGQMSFIKGGLAHGDRINTVSPSYAEEIQTAQFGCGLDPLLRHRREALSGILNGIDTATWNPATDPHLQQNYDRYRLKDKQANTLELLQSHGLQQHTEAPLVGFIGRLVAQKGLDLMLAAIPELLQTGARFIILGSGDQHLEQGLQQLAARFPGQVAVTIGYDEALSHRIEAGANIFLMPSRFEPCGLNQMYSLRYGTLPVVHRCGGLADTVVDYNADTLANGSANGFSFDHPDTGGLLYAMRRALDAYQDSALWLQLQRQAMVRDWSWRRSALAYQQLYQDAAIAATEAN